MKDRLIFFVSPCVMTPELQACPVQGEQHWGIAFCELLKESGSIIIPLPCPETLFCGVPRKPKGVKYYSELPGFTDFCREQAKSAVNQHIEEWAGRKIYCLGVERSPTCAVSYMRTENGTEHRKGIFFQFLYGQLAENGISVEMIGINRQHPGRALKIIRNLLEKASKESSRGDQV